MHSLPTRLPSPGARERTGRAPVDHPRAMSDDEAEGADKKLEDAYAAELADDGDDYDGAVKRAKVVKPIWCLVTKLAFDSPEKVQKLKEVFEPYAAWIKANEPGTLSYSLVTSDKDPLRVMMIERYSDRLDSYLVKHKQSAEFGKFRPALAALAPTSDEHSYFESSGGFFSR